MGEIRNGARTFLNLMKTACRLSHLPGFQTGLERILGASRADDVLQIWNPLCIVIEGLVATDNFYNKIDTVAEAEGDEDVTLG